MAHHAYFYAGNEEEGIVAARTFCEKTLGLTGSDNPDVLLYRFSLFSVDDARRISEIASLAPVAGDQKVLILCAERLFHQTQNALLKLFEEPTPGTTLVLIIPSKGLLQPTLLSRLIPLSPTTAETYVFSPEARQFISASADEREKLVAKLLERAKSDKDEEKQHARGEALRIVEGLSVSAHEMWQKKPTQELELFLRELERFIPILHERSAPLKLIFEHVLLVLPKLSVPK